jgi:hypothetical protein
VCTTGDSTGATAWCCMTVYPSCPMAWRSPIATTGTGALRPPFAGVRSRPGQACWRRGAGADDPSTCRTRFPCPGPTAAFSGINHGGVVRGFSNRGQASLGGGFRGGAVAGGDFRGAPDSRVRRAAAGFSGRGRALAHGGGFTAAARTAAAGHR